MLYMVNIPLGQKNVHLKASRKYLTGRLIAMRAILTYFYKRNFLDIFLQGILSLNLHTTDLNFKF